MQSPIKIQTEPRPGLLRHATLVYLIGLVISLFLPAFLQGAGSSWIWELVIRSILVFSASLFLYWSTGHLRIWWFGLVILGFIWLAYLPIGLHKNSIYLAEMATVLMFGYSLVWLFRTVLIPKVVDENTILSAVCAYLAIGFIASVFCSILERNIPGSFVAINAIGSKVDLQYFSFVSLSTLGFGDVVPTNGKARSLTVMIALVGQLYLTIVIATLVGKFLSKRKA